MGGDREKPAAVALGGFGGADPASAHCTINAGGCYGGHCYINMGTCYGSCYINGPLAYCGSGASCTVNVATCTTAFILDDALCSALPGCEG